MTEASRPEIRTYRALKATLETVADVAIDLGIGALSRTYVGQTYQDVIADITRLAAQSGIDADGIMRITVEPRTVRVGLDVGIVTDAITTHPAPRPADGMFDALTGPRGRNVVRDDPHPSTRVRLV